MLKSKIKQFQKKLDEFDSDKLVVGITSILAFTFLLILCMGIWYENIVVTIVFAFLFGVVFCFLSISIRWLSTSKKELIKAEKSLIKELDKIANKNKYKNKIR